MGILSFLSFIDNFKWFHWVVLAALAAVIVLAVVFFRLNTKTQMKVSFNMDDETNVYNQKGIDIFISHNQKKYTSPTLVVVELKNLAIIYKRHAKKRELMVRISDMLLKGLRAEETLARIEFNKFAIIYNDRSRDEIRERLVNFEKELCSDDFDKSIDIKFVITFGVYEKPELKDKIADIKLAESSILLSPIKDKNIYYYCDDVTVSLSKKNRINEAKQLALDENRFVSYIQPKVSLATGEVIGGEILCRWVDEMQNPIYSPGEFIPIFEENGFIKQIDDLMFKNACLMAATLVRRGYNDIVISVNLSKADIEGVDIVKKLLDICNENQVFPKNIELEITESAVMNNNKLVSSVIMQLRQAGFRVAMDDFGKEYSSLSSLVDNPFDTIKIDGVFFRDGLQTEKSANIAKDILVMLSKLNVEVVCEGVETKETVDKIAAVTKDVVIQGFYFSKPIPTYQFESFVETKYDFDFPEEEEHFYNNSDEELAYLRNKVADLENQLRAEKKGNKKNRNYSDDNTAQQPQQQVPYPYPYPAYGFVYPQYPQQPQPNNNDEIEALKREIENLKNNHSYNNNSVNEATKNNSSKKSKKKEPQPEPKTEDEEFDEYIKQFDEPEEVIEEALDPNEVSDEEYEEYVKQFDNPGGEATEVVEEQVESTEEAQPEVQEEPVEEVVEEPQEDVVEEALDPNEVSDEEYEEYVKQFDNPEGEATEVVEEQVEPTEEALEQDVQEEPSQLEEVTENVASNEESQPEVQPEDTLEPEVQTEEVATPSEEAPTEPVEESDNKGKKSKAKKSKKK